MEFLCDAKELAYYDIVVAGGGPAGIGAAVSAAREGMKTLLVEHSGCLGGVSTSGALPMFLGAMTGSISFPQMLEKGLAYKDLNRPAEAVAGVFKQMYQRMRAAQGGVGPCVVAQTDRYPGLDRLGCHDEVIFDIEIGKRVFDEMVTQAGAQVLYYTSVVGAKRTGDHIDGIYIYNKSGICYVPCGAVIDCTGDADVVAAADFPFYKGDRETGEMTHVSLVTHIEGIDFAEMEAYLNDGGDPWFREQCERCQKEHPELDVPHRLIAFPMLQEGVIMVNGGTSAYGYDGTSGEDMTKLTLWGRQRAKLLAEVLFPAYIPGGKNAKLRLTAMHPGVRETRRIEGEATITDEMMLSGEGWETAIAVAGRHFDLSRAPVNAQKQLKQPQGHRFFPNGAAIPYGALIPQTSENILVAGRCIAAEGQALGPARIMSTCMAMGEAAGLAAAMRKDGQRFVDVDVQALRQALRDRGAIVDQPKY